MYFFKVKVLNNVDEWVDCMLNVQHIVSIKPQGEYTEIQLDKCMFTNKYTDNLVIPTRYEDAEKMILEALKRDYEQKNENNGTD